MEKPTRGLTRREIAAAMTALSPALAQTPEKPAPADELAAAREQAKRTSAALRKFEVSMLVEPSFVFRP